MNFDLDAGIVQGIKTAKDNFIAMTTRLSVCAKQNFLYGRDFIKTTDISPDALMQLSFQVMVKIYRYFKTPSSVLLFLF